MAAPDLPSQLRAVELAVVRNARHLGGLPSTNGPTSLHDVLRSGSLARLLPAGVETLRAIGVQVVVDLRTAEERVLSAEPDLSAFGLTQAWIPVVERDPAPHGVNLEYGHAGFLWMYQNFLEYGRLAMSRLVRTLAETEGGVLYHCSAGQDRTGLVSAVLLSLVGVHDEAIVDDHSLSVTVGSLAERGITGAAATQRTTAPLHAMAATLAMVRERWGSSEGYLLAAGASPAAIAEVRARAHR